METPLTEYHFVELRKSFRDWLIQEIPCVTSDDLIASELFEHAEYVAAKFIKYVCGFDYLLPPDTAPRLLELNPEDFAKLAGLYLAAGYPLQDLPKNKPPTRIATEIESAASTLFREDFSPLRELAARSSTSKAYTRGIQSRFFERTNELLCVSPEWWDEHPDDARIWKFVLAQIFTRSAEFVSIFIIAGELPAHYQAHLDFTGLLDFTSSLFRQRADDIPDEAEREFIISLVDTSLAFLNDTFFLNCLSETLYNNLTNVQAADLLRLCGFVYINSLFMCSLRAEKPKCAPPYDYATWLFGLDEHDFAPQIEAQAIFNADRTRVPERQELDPVFQTPQEECNRIFSIEDDPEPVLLTLWPNLFYAALQRIGLAPVNKQDTALKGGEADDVDQITTQIRELPPGAANERSEEAAEHFTAIEEAARNDILSRARRAMRLDDFQLLRRVVNTTATRLTSIVSDQSLSPAFYEHLSSCTTAGMTNLYGLAYLDVLVLLASFDCRNRVTERLFRPSHEVFKLSHDVIALHRTLAERAQQGERIADLDTSFHPAIREFFAPALPQDADYIQEWYQGLLSSLVRAIEHTEQMRRATKQGNNLGCLGTVIGLLAIAAVAIVLVLIFWNKGR